MKLKDLTEQQKERLKEIREEYINKALTFKEIDLPLAKEVIEFVWGLINKPMPTVHQVSSPFAAEKKANELKGTGDVFYQFGTYLTIYWQSFYAYYDTFVEFGVIGEEHDKYFKLRKIVDTGIFSTIEFENDIVICEKPIKCERNEAGLHCLTGSAIKWRDGYEQFYINGRKIKKDWYLKCLEERLTKEEFVNEQNDEDRSAAYMILGEEKMMKLLEADLIDEQTIVHKNGEIEKIGFYRTRENLNIYKNEPYAWRKVSCPSTNTVYFTPTNPRLKDAIEVAKFHRPDFVPNEIPYSWYSRS